MVDLENFDIKDVEFIRQHNQLVILYKCIFNKEKFDVVIFCVPSDSIPHITKMSAEAMNVMIHEINKKGKEKMPVTVKQKKAMCAAEHNPKVRKGMKVTKKVAKEMCKALVKKKKK